MSEGLECLPQRWKQRLRWLLAGSRAGPAAALSITALALALALAGCMRGKPPRMVSVPGPVVVQAVGTPTVRIALATVTLAPTITPIPSVTPTPTGMLVPGTEITITVCPKDTLYSLACEFHTTVAAIQARNSLGTSTDIRIGQILVIPIGSEPPCPAPRIHIVRRGETIFSIARRYGVNVQSLVQINGLTDPNQIYKGQKLTIPAIMPCPTPCRH